MSIPSAKDMFLQYCRSRRQLDKQVCSEVIDKYKDYEKKRIDTLQKAKERYAKLKEDPEKYKAHLEKQRSRTKSTKGAEGKPEGKSTKGQEGKPTKDMPSERSSATPSEIDYSESHSESHSERHSEASNVIYPVMRFY